MAPDQPSKSIAERNTTLYNLWPPTRARGGECGGGGGGGGGGAGGARKEVVVWAWEEGWRGGGGGETTLPVGCAPAYTHSYPVYT